MKEKYKCPCCGFWTLESEGEYEICPVCFWEDDPVQGKDPEKEGGANKPSLTMARENYKTFWASDESLIGLVREPFEEELTRQSISQEEMLSQETLEAKKR